MPEVHIGNIGGIYILQPGDWVMESVITQIFGLSTDQLKKYRNEGDWLEDREWTINPRGRVVYNPKAIGKWMGGLS